MKGLKGQTQKPIKVIFFVFFAFLNENIVSARSIAFLMKQKSLN